MKIILDLVDDIVVRAQKVEDSVIENVTDNSPYCKEDDLGNGYAVSLRKKDLGMVDSIMIYDSGEPLDYFNKELVGDKFEVYHETEDHRHKHNSMTRAKYRIWSEDSNLYPSKDQVKELSTILGEDKFGVIFKKIMKYERLDQSDLSAIESSLGSMTEGTKIVAINQVANNLSMKDNDEEKLKLVVKWWAKLIGTSEEIKGLAGIASSYTIAMKYCEAIATYELMLTNPKLKSGQKEEIDQRILDVGRGQELYEKAMQLASAADSIIGETELVALDMSIQYAGADTKEKKDAIDENYMYMVANKINDAITYIDKAVEKIDEFNAIKSGIVAVSTGAMASTLEAMCLGKRGRLSGNDALVNTAQNMLSNPVETGEF